MLARQFVVDIAQLEGGDGEALGLYPPDDLSDQAPLHAVGLDQNQGPLSHGRPRTCGCFRPGDGADSPLPSKRTSVSRAAASDGRACPVRTPHPTLSRSWSRSSRRWSSRSWSRSWCRWSSRSWSRPSSQWSCRWSDPWEPAAARVRAKPAPDWQAADWRAQDWPAPAGAGYTPAPAAGVAAQQPSALAPAPAVPLAVAPVPTATRAPAEPAPAGTASRCC